MSEKKKKTYKHSEVGNTCIFSGHIGNQVSDSAVICEYILRTGKRRGCKGEACDKYIPKPESENKPAKKRSRKKEE